MTVIPFVQPEVLEFVSELSYLSGYKAAVFDTKIRFESSEAEVRSKWQREKDALERVAGFVRELLTSLESVELEGIEEHLSERINARKVELGVDNLEFQAELYETERAIGLIANIRKEHLLAA
jgi:hypothetical protein